MKKILVFILAILMIACMAIPAYAAGEASTSTVADADAPGFIVYWCKDCHRLVLTPFKDAHEAIHHHEHTETTSTDIKSGNGKLSTDVEYVAKMDDPYNPGNQVDAYEWWEVSVPKTMKPGAEADVKITGVWDPSKKLTVTADSSVTIKWGVNQKTLDVTLATTEISGSLESKIDETRKVEVEDVTLVLGTWKGTFNYTVKFN